MYGRFIDDVRIYIHRLLHGFFRFISKDKSFSYINLSFIFSIYNYLRHLKNHDLEMVGSKT